MKATHFSSRRDFLKQTAVLTGVTVTGLSTLRVHAAGDDLVKIGLIGCGGRGCGAVTNVFDAVPNARLVAMADVFDDRAKNARNQLKTSYKDLVDVPDERCFSGFDGYKNVIANSDTVLIACASSFHPRYLLAAVEAKKHVFVEKPHALDANGIKIVQKATEIAENNKTSLVSGLCYRYDTLRREAFQRIADGEIGEITSVQSDYIRSPYSLVSRKEGWSEIEYQFRNWYHFTWLAGDEILQSLLHNIDSVMTAFGEETPVSAYGIGGRSSMFVEEMGDQFDHTAMILNFADGKRIYGMTRCATQCFNSNTDILHGTKGRCVFKSTGKPYFTNLKNEKTWTAGERQRNMYVQEQYEFVTSIINGKPINDGQRMARTTMAGILGFIACRTGQEVRWDETLQAAEIYGTDVTEFSFDLKPPITPNENGVYPLAVPGKAK
ncbi:MAG: Gfo/Idh/MocA family oxidoreductase [Planctomycetaceae bacterium]|jgi:predicted dehydrogenase|nr:Gfo/Idh/MocA family oxidoreductase [Planctomycetaceae bacterium]